jgi:pyrimidine and pyridine-specific 5'-nucleotidase
MKIHDMMVVKIREYFIKHLQISDEEANKLQYEYYQSYGLAIEGLVRHHKIGNLEKREYG